MKLIAIHTVHGNKKVRDRDQSDPMSRPVYEDLIAKPGDEFESKEFNIDANEVDALIKAGTVRRKTKQVADDSDKA